MQINGMNTEKAELRRYEDDLNVSGTGVIVLGAWSIIRVLIELFMNTKEYLNFDGEDPDSAMMGMVLVIAIIVVVSFVIMKIHLYIGLNAMRAAKGREHKEGYFVAAIIIAVLSVLSLATYAEDLQDLDKIDTTLASILVDITTIYIFIVVIVSSIRIKKIKGES